MVQEQQVKNQKAYNMEIKDSPGTKKAKKEAEYANLKSCDFESFPVSYS